MQKFMNVAELRLVFGTERPCALFSDIDETLTTHGRLTLDALHARGDLERASIPLILVTGRAAGFAWTLFQILGADALVAENGGLIYLKEDPERPWIFQSEDQDTSANPLYTQEQGSLHHLKHIRQRAQTLFDALLKRELLPPKTTPTHDNLFRLSDFTFPIQGLAATTLSCIRTEAKNAELGFVYSTIHGHFSASSQEKGRAVEWICAHRGWPTNRVLTLGDSPNDASLFDPSRFPCSAAVANFKKYADQSEHHPRYLCSYESGEGFAELVHLFAANS